MVCTAMKRSFTLKSVTGWGNQLFFFFFFFFFFSLLEYTVSDTIAYGFGLK